MSATRDALRTALVGVPLAETGTAVANRTTAVYRVGRGGASRSYMGGGEVMVAKAPSRESTEWQPLPPQRRRSRGLSFGNSGPGAKDLALTILMDYLGAGREYLALAYYEGLTRRWVAELAGPGPHYLESLDLEWLLLTLGMDLVDARGVGG